MCLEKCLVSNLYPARQGNSQAREEILAAAKPFIRHVIEKICGRVLEWGRSDELSIGLIAFDEAIDRFQEERNIPFLAFARLVIRSRLNDYFRKEARHNKITFPDTADWEPLTSGLAWENYLLESSVREREEEVREFQSKLAEFKISFAELVSVSPKHRDSRENLIKAAWELANKPVLINQLQKTKRLPVKELAGVCGLHRKTIEKARKYIVAVALLFYWRERFIYMYSYLKLTDWWEGGTGSGQS